MQRIIRTLVAQAIAACALGAQAQNLIDFRLAGGDTLYIRMSDASSHAYALSRGSLLLADHYTLAVASVTGLPAGTYTAAAYVGTPGSQSAGDQLVMTFAAFEWDGSDVVDPLANVGFVAIAPTKVHELRTWYASKVDGSRSDNIREIKAFSGTVTFAVEPLLNADADIESVTSVDVSAPSPATETATNYKVRADGRAGHFDLTSLTTLGTYTIVAEVLTKDGQSLPMRCILKVK